MIVARHDVPGTAPPQKSRPVGYGMIRRGRRTVSMIGATRDFEYAAPIPEEKYLWVLLRTIIPYPTGRFSRWTISQALRARLRSCCPSGT